MCTAATYKTKDFYFGRTLDYEFSYGDEITVTPRNYPFEFRYMGRMDSHYAMIGMAHVAGDYPLYYDAINEKGLGMAGLNFVGNAAYQEADESEDRDNVAQYEFIPWILGWSPHEQPAISSADVPAQPVYGTVTEAASEHICTRSWIERLQPRHGGHRTSWGSVVHVKICQGGICEAEQSACGF